jgi:transposase
MMGQKDRRFDPLPRDTCLESLVPRGNFYRRLEERLNLSFVRELVRPLYAGGGRPSVDPVVFFKLQLVMFFEDLRSERQLMRAVADRLSLRWYLGYDLHETLTDHSSLTRIRGRFGLSVFRRFFEKIVEMCVEAGLVRGRELFFDATKVEADAALDSLAPRWFVERYLQDLFEDDPGGQEDGARDARDTEDAEPVRGLPTAGDEELIRANSAKRDWISRGGAQGRSFEGTPWRERTADPRASRTDLRETQQWNWYGEGDDMIFIDGEGWPPSLHGTGTEDYFNTAWSPKQEYSAPYHGITLGGGDNWSGHVSLYRFHVEDPVTFEKSIRVTLEHGHANKRSDDFSSVAYWYQVEPHRPFPISPVRQRIPRQG